MLDYKIKLLLSSLLNLPFNDHKLGLNSLRLFISVGRSLSKNNHCLTQWFDQVSLLLLLHLRSTLLHEHLLLLSLLQTSARFKINRCRVVRFPLIGEFCLAKSVLVDVLSLDDPLLFRHPQNGRRSYQFRMGQRIVSNTIWHGL